jgi:uncharacterized protein YxjI
MHCGKELPPNAVFCPNCGAKVTVEITPPSTASSPAYTGLLTRSQAHPLFSQRKYILDQRPLALRATYEIKDASSNLLGYAKKKMLSIGPKLWFEDLQGRELGKIEGKAIAIGTRGYSVYDEAGVLRGIVKKKLLAFKPSYVIEDPSGRDLAKIKGKLLAHDYSILSPDGRTLAQVSKKWVSLRDSYGLEIFSDEADPFLALSFVTICDDIEHR